MQSTQTLVQSIIEESKNAAGTWSYTFLKNVHMRAKQMKSKDYNILIDSLMNYAMEESTEELSRFKIVQLVSSTRAQCISQNDDIFVSNKEKWVLFASTLPDSVLGRATSKLINNIYYAKRSPLGQPRFVSASTPIVRTSKEKEIIV